jgi:hypothetical protein
MRILKIAILLFITNSLFAQSVFKPDAGGISQNGLLWYSDITWFGAKTTNADNATAINAALATGKPVFIPPGVWLHGALTGPVGATIFGVDSVVSVLKWKSGAANSTHQLTIGSNTTIKNIRIDGNSANVAVTTSHSIFASTAKNLTIDGVYITHSPEQAIEFDNVDNYKIVNTKIDTTGKHGMQLFNARYGVIRDVWLTGWDLGNASQSAIAITGTTATAVSQDILISNLHTVNRFSANFSVETGGNTVQTKHITIENSSFVSHAAFSGGAGVSMSWDSSAVINCVGIEDTTGYGIECSGSHNLYFKNDFKNLKIVIGTYLLDTSRGNIVTYNTVRMTDPRQMDAAIQLGGHTAAGTLLNGVYQDNKIMYNTIDSREGNLQVGMLIGNTNSGKGVLLANEISENKSFGTAYLMAFDGVRGNNNKILNNTVDAGHTVVLYFSGGPYNFTQISGNVAPGGSVYGTGVNNTNFPNFTDFFNVTDTAAATQTGTGNIIPKSVSPAFTGTPTVPTASRLTGGTQAASQAYVDNEAGMSSLVISAAATGISLGTRYRYFYAYIDPSVSLGSSALSVTLPTSPQNGDMVYIIAGRQVATGATVSTNFSITSSGSLVYGTVPTTLVGGDCLIFMYQPVATQWLRIKP